MENQDNFDQKIRQIYKERNIRFFGHTSNQGSGGTWLVRLFMLVLVVVVSVVTSLIVVVNYYPSGVSVSLINRSGTTNELLVNEKIKNSIVNFFYENNSVATDPVRDTYLVDQSLGQGLVLSSDGWLVTTNQVLKDINRSYVVDVSDKIYAVEKIIKDTATPFIYVKINSSNLPVTGFEDIIEVRVGDRVLVLASGGQKISNDLLMSNISSWQSYGEASNYQGLVQSSEIVEDNFYIAEKLDNKFLGSPVVSLNNKVIGLMGKSGNDVRVVYPLELVDSIMNDLFSGSVVTRPTLGIKYINTKNLLLSHGYEPVLAVGMLLSTGGTTVKNPESGSAAQLAGLKNGDIIVEIGGQNIDGTLSLSYLVQQFESKATIPLRVVRGGEIIKLDVKLGEVILKSVSVE